MRFLKNIAEYACSYSDSLSELCFPRLCFGCNHFAIEPAEYLCLSCLSTLPYTRFEQIRNNPVEKLFWGRVELNFAASTYYFQEETPVQQAIHALKYGNQPELGVFLGELMGNELVSLLKTNPVDALVPMPIHPRKESIRGYNQATMLCRGISRITGLPILDGYLIRKKHTSTQTKKSRIERWENVASMFEVIDSGDWPGRNLLLVDDVITTGASAEACAQTLIDAGINKVGIYSLAYTL